MSEEKKHDNLIDFAPHGWGVYESKCVNCKMEWVAVAPHMITDLSTCPYCDKNKDIFELFETS